MARVTAGRQTPVECGSDGTMRSSCLWLHLFGLKRFSFLPDFQRDGRDLSRERQPRHLRSNPFCQQSAVVVAEYSRTDGRHGRGTFENVFEVVVVIPVQTADLHEPRLAFYLAVNHVILRAVVCF